MSFTASGVLVGVFALAALWGISWRDLPHLAEGFGRHCRRCGTRRDHTWIQSCGNAIPQRADDRMDVAGVGAWPLFLACAKEEYTRLKLRAKRNSFDTQHDATTRWRASVIP